MANPNILTATSIYGKSICGTIEYDSSSGDPGSNADILTNPSGSGKVFKINNWTASSDETSYNIVAIFSLRKNGSYTKLLRKLLAAGEKVSYFSRENPFYLEENDTLVLHSSATTTGSYVVSYEEIS